MKVVTIGADDSVEEAPKTMKDHKVRRLPVIDGHEVVGMVSQGDVATALPDDKVGELVEAISAAPRQNAKHDRRMQRRPVPQGAGRFAYERRGRDLNPRTRFPKSTH
ncbi:MAG: hypothetical protein JWP02_3615 [Acidimicrobiales bacterium]|nr:hypothetical protein [Acidimicrobiales bacterium]